jgi:4-hydroxythreonine-4-phosphate dehydrogenase
LGIVIPKIVLTTGEPAGVGPDITIEALAEEPRDHHLVAIADRGLLEERAALLGRALPPLEAYDPARVEHTPTPARWILHVPLRQRVEPGRLERGNAAYVLDLLETACAGLETRRFDALVTAPVHKSILNDEGRAFRGHTEYLARRFGVPRPVMLFVDRSWRVALLTTHLPLSAVPRAVTPGALEETLNVLVEALKRFYGIAQPRVAVLGLNPHAGEGGSLGEEERTVLGPALERLGRERGWRLSPPLPADTAFLPEVIDGYDAVLGMYHDQVLPVIKQRGFASAVNVTLGLPFPRTSVDHGTALERAGRGTAHSENLRAAIRHAVELLAARDSGRTPGA